MSKKIDVRTLINTFNAENTQGQYMFVPAELVEFLEKLASDNGVGNAETALVGALTQARMYHQQYEENMIERFIDENRVQYIEDAEDTDISEPVASNYKGWGSSAAWPKEESVCGCASCSRRAPADPELETETETDPMDMLRAAMSGKASGGVVIIGAGGLGGLGGAVPPEVLAQLGRIISDNK